MIWVTIIIQVIGFLIKYGPDLVAIVKEIFDHLRHLKDPSAQLAFANELGDLVGAYKGGVKDKRPFIDLLARVAAAVHAQGA